MTISHDFRKTLEDALNELEKPKIEPVSAGSEEINNVQCVNSIAFQNIESMTKKTTPKSNCVHSWVQILNQDAILCTKCGFVAPELK